MSLLEEVRKKMMDAQLKKQQIDEKLKKTAEFKKDYQDCLDMIIKKINFFSSLGGEEMFICYRPVTSFFGSHEKNYSPTDDYEHRLLRKMFNEYKIEEKSCFYKLNWVL